MLKSMSFVLGCLLAVGCAPAAWAQPSADPLPVPDGETFEELQALQAKSERRLGAKVVNRQGRKAAVRLRKGDLPSLASFRKFRWNDSDTGISSAESTVRGFLARDHIAFDASVSLRVEQFWGDGRKTAKRLLSEYFGQPATDDFERAFLGKDFRGAESLGDVAIVWYLQDPDGAPPNRIVKLQFARENVIVRLWLFGDTAELHKIDLLQTAKEIDAVIVKAGKAKEPPRPTIDNLTLGKPDVDGDNFAVTFDVTIPPGMDTRFTTSEKHGSFGASETIDENGDPNSILNQRFTYSPGVEAKDTLTVAILDEYGRWTEKSFTVIIPGAKKPADNDANDNDDGDEHSDADADNDDNSDPDGGG